MFLSGDHEVEYQSLLLDILFGIRALDVCRIGGGGGIPPPAGN